MSKPLFCAYYSAEEVIRHQLSETFESFNSTIAQTLGNKASVSYFSATLMAHLAQRGLKEACQDLWRRYSKMTSLAFLPKEPWMYCLWHSEEGDNHSFIPPETGQWPDLVATSQIDIQTSIPSLLAERPLLLALWCLLAPHRATTPVICHLYNSFSASEKSMVDAAPAAEAA
jgi:hypothetical protein